MKNLLSPTKAVFAAFFASLALWALRFHGRLPAVTDVFLFNYPCYSVNLQEWAKGFVPLWDAATGCGTPQLADSQSAVAYPPFWIWNLTGLSHWLVWMAILHSAFAFGGFYLWARTQRIAGVWAALGALSFAGSLHMVRCWGYPSFNATLSWTPWIFWAAAQWLQTGRRWWWLALAAGIGVQILAGYPFFSFYTLSFLLIWTLFQTSPRGRKALLLGTIPAALGFTAVHWLPFLDTLSYSTRGGWGSPDRFPFFTKPTEYLTLLDPAALGDPGTAFYQGQTANAAFLLYFGLIPLAAWSLGGFFRKFQGRLFWGISGWAWLLWLMGPRFPLWRLVPEAGLELLDPSKAVGMFIFAACTCAGLVLTHLFQEPGLQKRKMVLWVIATLWMADILSVPFRTLHPVPDPYQKPSLQDWAGQVGEAAQGRRILGFKAKGETPVYGGESEEEVLEKASDDWVQDFLANSPAAWGLRGSQAYLSTWTDSMDLFWRSFNKLETYSSALPDVAGIGALYLPVALPSPHYSEMNAQRQNHLLKNNFCREDAWPAYGSQTFPSQEAVLEDLEQGRPGSQEPAEIDLEQQPVELPPPQRNLSITDVSPDEGFHRPCGSRADFEKTFSKPGWLFWNEAFTPGWRAWVDGNPVPIQRADGFFMAAPIASAGSHRVDFRYEPTAFRLGLFISFVFVALGMAGVFLPWLRNQGGELPLPSLSLEGRG